jgi:hypothetical protein
VAVLVGIKSDEPIESVAASVSQVLGVTLRPRDSSHWGSPYYTCWPESEIKLTANLDPMFREGDSPDDRWFSSSGRDATYLIWETADARAVVATLRLVGLDAEVVEHT